jgi:hypothetical protein
MYTEHPSFLQPPDDNENLWRYMDFTKFVSLIARSALHFTRGDKFDDQFEGSYPRINAEARERIYDSCELPEILRLALPQLRKTWADPNNH